MMKVSFLGSLISFQGNEIFSQKPGPIKISPIIVQKLVRNRQTDKCSDSKSTGQTDLISKDLPLKQKSTVTILRINEIKTIPTLPLLSQVIDVLINITNIYGSKSNDNVFLLMETSNAKNYHNTLQGRLSFH